MSEQDRELLYCDGCNERTIERIGQTCLKCYVERLERDLEAAEARIEAVREVCERRTFGPSTRGSDHQWARDVLAALTGKADER